MNSIAQFVAAEHAAADRHATTGRPLVECQIEARNNAAEDAWKAHRIAADLAVLQRRLAADHRKRVDACLDAWASRCA